MTPQQIEALKLALEALEGFYEYGYDRQECFEHITAIKEALLEHAMHDVQRLGQEIEPKIGCVNHDCDHCKAQPEQEACKEMEKNAICSPFMISELWRLSK